jgi:prophage maintenance system killer protein
MSRSNADDFVLRGSEGAERLRSALAQPQWRFHRTLPAKAAALMYYLCVGHPYIDGNKRMALVASEYFLNGNQHVFAATHSEAAALARGLASGCISPEFNRRFFAQRALPLRRPDRFTSLFNAIPERKQKRLIAEWRRVLRG